jgi:hypothetical protein
MNDTMSLLLATGILAVGGLGLFMYKNTSDDKESDKENESLFDFDLRSYFGNSDEEENKEENTEENYKEPYPEVFEQPKRSRGSKTKSSRKNIGTKRRY